MGQNSKQKSHAQNSECFISNILICPLIAAIFFKFLSTSIYCTCSLDIISYVLFLKILGRHPVTVLHEKHSLTKN